MGEPRVGRRGACAGGAGGRRRARTGARSTCWSGSTRWSSPRPTAGSRWVPPTPSSGCSPTSCRSVIEAGGGPDGPLRWRGLHLHVGLTAGRRGRVALGDPAGAPRCWRSSGRRCPTSTPSTWARASRWTTAWTARCPDPRCSRRPRRTRSRRSPQGARPTRLAIEPGRAIVAAAGWLVARVLHVKERAGVRRTDAPGGPRHGHDRAHPARAVRRRAPDAWRSPRWVDPVAARRADERGARRRTDLRVDRPAGRGRPAAARPGRPGRHRRGGCVRVVDGLDLQRPPATTGGGLGWVRAAAASPSRFARGAPLSWRPAPGRTSVVEPERLHHLTRGPAPPWPRRRW